MDQSSKTTLFPVFLALRGRPCTVVGGGAVAARRARALLAAGAKVRVVAEQVGSELRKLVGHERLELAEREFRPGDLKGSALAFAATDCPDTNTAVCREARSLGVLVNVADTQDLCDFIMPARVERPPISIAVCTNGASPALARHLGERLAGVILPEDQKLANLLGRLRREVFEAVPSADERRRRWREVLDSDALNLLREGSEAEAEFLARRLLGIEAGSKPSAMPRCVLIGTRGSKLALAQAGWVAARLWEAGASASLHTIRTAGDNTRRPLDDSNGGWFVREIEEALRRREVDLAVHSLKDLPTGPRDGLLVAAMPERADPRDALITRTGDGLSGLPEGSRVGSSSPRRVAQLRALRPDLVFASVRGNVDTRLRKLRRGEFDALVLAYAGLLRLGMAESACELLPVEVCLPAPGQGALALQVRECDRDLRELVSALDHAPTRLAVEAERAFLAHLGGGCGQGAGALAIVEEDRMLLRVAAVEPRSDRVLRRCAECPADEGQRVARALAEEMLHEWTALA